jgi:hypothetical protein
MQCARTSSRCRCVARGRTIHGERISCITQTQRSARLTGAATARWVLLKAPVQHVYASCSPTPSIPTSHIQWADCHPELTKRELWENQGWPGCCTPIPSLIPSNSRSPMICPQGRAPSQSEYQLFIKPEDWAAVSHLFKLSRSSSTSSDASKINGAKDDAALAKLRNSPRTKAATTWPAGTASFNDSNVSGRPGQVRGATDPVVRSGSPLRRTVTPPPNLAPGVQPTQRSTKTTGTSKSSQSTSDDSPDTPPARSFKELTAQATTKRSDQARSTTTRDVTVVRYSPTEMEALVSTTPRRQTIAIQNHSAFYRNKGNDDPTSVISAPTLPKVRQNPSPTSGVSSLRSSPRAPQTFIEPARNQFASPREQGPQSAPTIEVLPISTRELPEERMPRFTAGIPSIGMKFMSDNFVVASPESNPDRPWPPAPSSSSSSSSSSSHSSRSSDDGFASETSTSSRGSFRSEISDASTTRGGGSSSSDFTDFLSDDSEYEIQRQAEERAAHLQRLRVERAEDREFRDAQQSLELFDLTESMDLRPAPTMNVGINGTIGRRGTLLANPRNQEQPFQGVFVGRIAD